MYNSFFIHSSVDGHLGCFHVLAVVRSAAVNIGVHVSFSIMVFSGYMPSSQVTGLYESFIPSILRNLHIVLHSGCSSSQNLGMSLRYHVDRAGFTILKIYVINLCRSLEYFRMVGEKR